MNGEEMLPLAPEYTTDHPIVLGTRVQFRRPLRRSVEPLAGEGWGKRRTWEPLTGDSQWRPGVVVGVRTFQNGLSYYGGEWIIEGTVTAYLIAYHLRRSPVGVRFQDVRPELVNDG